MVAMSQNQWKSKSKRKKENKLKMLLILSFVFRHGSLDRAAAFQQSVDLHASYWWPYCRDGRILRDVAPGIPVASPLPGQPISGIVRSSSLKCLHYSSGDACPSLQGISSVAARAVGMGPAVHFSGYSATPVFRLVPLVRYLFISCMQGEEFYTEVTN